MIKRILKPIERFFVWSYSSQYNPLYHSGSLAVGMLMALIISGCYLIFFYSVGSPYDSMVDIQNQWYLGRWVRSFHRYTSDAAIVIIIYHVLVMFSQGKSWGPRTLAWISGVLLSLSIMISAWTGFVMVWDQHGQMIAQEGAKLFLVFPFLRDDLIAAFSGQTPIPASFFFMNLFLHVAVPLGMVFGLWIHTSRMARVKVFPDKKIFKYVVLALIGLSVLWPAPLLERGDLTSVVNRILVDFWFGGIYWSNQLIGPTGSLLLLVGGISFLISVVFWSKPKAKKTISPAINNEEACTGCTQCYKDCPYDAITMIPSNNNAAKKVARPDPDICALCGICAGSCSELNIAPPELNGSLQLEAAKVFADKHSDHEAYVIMGCSSNFSKSEDFEKTVAKNFKSAKVVTYPSTCTGQIHTYVVKYFLQHFKGVYIWTCPERACANRDGPEMLKLRLLGRNLPSFNVRGKNRDRVEIASYSCFEMAKVNKSFNVFTNAAEVDKKSLNLLEILKRSFATVVILLFIGITSRVPLGSNEIESVVRLDMLLPNLIKENCHKPTAEENKNLQVHMRKLMICDEVFLKHSVVMKINDKLVVSQELAEKKGESQKTRVYLDHPVSATGNRVVVQLVTKNLDGSVLEEKTFDRVIESKKGKIELIHFDKNFSLKSD